MKISRHLTSLAFLLLTAMLLASCSDSTITPGSGDSGNSAMPPVGATVTHNNVTLDPTGAPIEATRHVVTATVSHPQEYNGKTKVAEFKGDFGTPIHVAYEENGNVALEYRLAHISKQQDVWITLPVATGTTVEEEIYRDTSTQGALTAITTASSKMEQFGTETLSVGTEAFQAIRIVGTITIVIDNTVSGQTTTSMMYVDFDISWILELGIYGRSDIDVRFDRTVPPQTTTHSTLVAYTMP